MYENGTLSAADVAAVTGNRGFGGFGGYGDGGMFWILILFLFAFMGNGWGNGFNGNAGGTVPYVQAGFDHQAVMSGINGLQTTVANGFANAEVAACNRAMNVANGFNQLALAGVQGFNSVNSGISDLKYTVATENCADRQAISDGLRDVIANNTANTNAIIQSQQSGFQGIQDKLCQIEIDNLKAQNEQLRTQLNMANLAASQNAQTAEIGQMIRQSCGCGCNTNTCCG